MTAPGGFSFSNLVMGREERLLEEGERERIAPADAAGAEVRATWVARERTDLFNEEPLVEGEPRRLFFATGEKVKKGEKPPAPAPKWSVRYARAQLYLPFFCCYNWFCCCWDVACCGLGAPFKWCGPLCGSKFWCKGWCLPCYIDARRDVWLRWMHFLCFAIHVTWLALTIEGAWGHDMNVQIVRVKPSFQMPGRYGFEVAASPGIPQIRYDLLVASFFGLSALMHSVWVFLGWTKWAKRALWDNLDNCLCWWRWLECKPAQLKPFTHSTTHTVSAACDRLAFCQRHVWYTSAFEPVQYTLLCFSQFFLQHPCSLLIGLVVLSHLPLALFYGLACFKGGSGAVGRWLS